MVSNVVDNINAGALPNFQEMFVAVINQEVSLNLEEAKEIFDVEFAQNVVEGMDEQQIDEMYHSTVNKIMKHIKGQLDPYLNIGEDIDQLFSEFVKVFNDLKQD